MPMAKARPAGAPIWMATFADMMSLLMCFFVLLLSFSEMDVKKFKQVASSMKSAFGVQRVVEAAESPSEDSAVVGNMSNCDTSATPSSCDTSATPKEVPANASAAPTPAQTAEAERLKQQKTEAEVQKVRESLAREIKEGRVDVEGIDGKIILRIFVRGAFPSGSADLKRDGAPLLNKIGLVLKATEGGIVIAGHSDNRPIRTRRYRSNWELSTARAVSVVHNLLATSKIDPARVEVRGYGDNLPLVPNDIAENRAINRRVEIIVTIREPAPEPAKAEAGEVPPKGDGEGTATDAPTKAEAEAAVKATKPKA
ncbi:MAG: OmpA family protein [Chromatiales bacterium]|nr:OmpA family protein [Chromatiales bacterium]